MLQNRVDPSGNIIVTSARGEWMGNRGPLHGKGKTILRPFKHKAWIICLLQFKCRHRQVMSPNLWTELFFLDEATALSAGHRPCFECRRNDANLFKAAWLKGNPEYGFSHKTSIKEIDMILHHERIDEAGEKVMFKADLEDLPEGSFIQIENEPYVVMDDRLFCWTPFGYKKGIPGYALKNVYVLTPKSIINAIGAGYKPQISKMVILDN